MGLVDGAHLDSDRGHGTHRRLTAVGDAGIPSQQLAAPVVKVQAERGHSIVDTGPYACVRHPMYSGAIPFFVGMPLLLCSWYGLIGSATTILALGMRAVGEERLLTAELDGYPEYAARVRYRLVPGVW